MGRDNWLSLMSEVSEGFLRVRRAVGRGSSAVLVCRGSVLAEETGRGIVPALKIATRVLANPHVPPADLVFGDKVLGLAAFRLGALMGARFMWGETASTLAVKEAERRGVAVAFFHLTPCILSPTHNRVCLMEALAFASNSDLDFYDKARVRLAPALSAPP